MSALPVASQAWLNAAREIQTSMDTLAFDASSISTGFALLERGQDLLLRFESGAICEDLTPLFRTSILLKASLTTYKSKRWKALAELATEHLTIMQPAINIKMSAIIREQLFAALTNARNLLSLYQNSSELAKDPSLVLPKAMLQGSYNAVVFFGKGIGIPDLKETSYI